MKLEAKDIYEVACMECGVMNERSVCDVCHNFGYAADNTQYEDEQA